MARMNLNALLVVVVGLVLCTSAVAAHAATPVVSGLTYSPKPLYDDETAVKVSFATSRAARRGYEWGVTLVITGKFVTLDCAPIVFSWIANPAATRTSTCGARASTR